MEIKIEQYKGIEVSVEKVELTDEIVDRQMQVALSQNPIQIEKEVIEEGNTAEFDFEGLKDGVAFDGGTAKGYKMVIGSHQFIPGFEEQMIGMKAGESKDVNVTFPEAYHEPSLAGQPVVFKVTVHKVFEEKPAELNEEFVESLGISDVHTVEELKDFIRKSLENEAQKQTDERVQNAVFDVLMEKVEGDLPQELVDQALQQQIQRISAELQQQGFSLEQYLEMVGQTMDDINAQCLEFAQKQTRLQCALGKVAELEGIENVDDEVDAQLQMIASSYGMEMDQIKEMIPRDELAKEIRLMKASQIVLDHAKVEFK